MKGSKPIVSPRASFWAGPIVLARQQHGELAGETIPTNGGGGAIAITCATLFEMTVDAKVVSLRSLAPGT